MAFYVDKQTYGDLAVLKDLRDPDNTVLGLLDKTSTIGGKEALITLLTTPFNDLSLIRERQQTIRCLQQMQTKLELDALELDFIEFYLNQNFLKSGSRIRRNEMALAYKLFPSRESYIVQRGVTLLLSVLDRLCVFTREMNDALPSDTLRKLADQVAEIVELPVFTRFRNIRQKKKKTWPHLPYFDYHLRGKAKRSVKELMSVIYQIDCYQSVANETAGHRFCFPEFTEDALPRIDISGLRHPFLPEAVKNNIRLGGESNLLFLTGSNMSGKTTLLKAFGIAVYLAHLGLPVPADRMVTSVLDGLMTTIQVTDSLKSGVSFFYQEVLRVKEVATALASAGRILVIFDELFKGTNVRDAHDASLAVIDGFCQVKNSLFVVSTHLIEVADHLHRYPVSYQCFKNLKSDGWHQYNYLLSAGISHERSGMYLLEQENVLALIRKAR